MKILSLEELSDYTIKNCCHSTYIKNVFTSYPLMLSKITICDLYNWERVSIDQEKYMVCVTSKCHSYAINGKIDNDLNLLVEIIMLNFLAERIGI